MLITFIGGGNMATALISGLVNPPRTHIRIRVSDPNPEAREHLESTFKVTTFADSREAVEGADVVLLAIKPQIMSTVLDQLKDRVKPGQLVLSIAAGTTMNLIHEYLGQDMDVVRSMPNTPALIGHGITGAVAGSSCTKVQRQQAEEILMAAGDVVWLNDESLMDAVTAISGTGPAYFFLLAEILAEAARDMGLPAETADRLASITCFGAGAMLASSPGEAGELRRRVTSPNGTTHAAMSLLDEEGYRDIVKRAAEAARRRSRELSGDTK
ncbi:MAG: pyrroline-5-carboxylate reductase [Xanthomonadales bacterium]|nr:pyrroline-5-carboxylate reductase [Gammaproteobacteria bacterium]MBT8049716.1 pyrroline-5-carboxylate reductase [Gammaproteobacteria bacterium]MBT8055686.1 pyrroline-5-carboxylate reductase [Gammaproteobacteria bacterium]NNJ78256.1 pyrroline-5-carboxylate reductase [Xanthomonadales bacterium]NNL04135.1 pyrroline-5-carboxylate reductase [Xanthomonadales bacterium]